MNQSIYEPFVQSKPKWQWTKVTSNFVTNINGRTQTISLKPNVFIEERIFEGLMFPQMWKKSLPYDTFVGWNWHKSSNLPPITLNVKLLDPKTKNPFSLPKNLQVNIFAVKINFNKLSRQRYGKIDDVGLKGITHYQLKQQFAVFDGLRFQTTSYINQGVKFHLLIILWTKQTQQEKNFKNIICSLVSPPIFVDSRKSARDYFQKRYVAFANVFNPCLLQKQFLKKSTKDKNQNQIKIENSLEGLFNYLTAPNIRHKVKHPLLLCIKFSAVFKIMVDTSHQIFQDNKPTIQAILVKFQKILLTEIGHERKIKKNIFLGCTLDKPFLVAISNQTNSFTKFLKNSRKCKILECLQILNCNSIEFVRDCSLIGSQFQNILQIGDISRVYHEIYQKLREMSKKQINLREKQIFFDKQQEADSLENGKLQNKKKSIDAQQVVQKVIKRQHINYQNYGVDKNCAAQIPRSGQSKLVTGKKNQYCCQEQTIFGLSNSRQSLNLLQDPFTCPQRHENPIMSYAFCNQFNAVNRYYQQALLSSLYTISNLRVNQNFHHSILQQISFQNSMLQSMITQNLRMKEVLTANMLNIGAGMLGVNLNINVNANMIGQNEPQGVNLINCHNFRQDYMEDKLAYVNKSHSARVLCNSIIRGHDGSLMPQQHQNSNK